MNDSITESTSVEDNEIDTVNIILLHVKVSIGYNALHVKRGFMQRAFSIKIPCVDCTRVKHNKK